MVQYNALDQTFAAVADATRRGILQRLGRRDESISDLASEFDMTLTGIKKHVRVLEHAGLVTTRKVGRVRMCQVGPLQFDDGVAWMEKHRRMVNERYNRLEAYLGRTRGQAS